MKNRRIEARTHRCYSKKEINLETIKDVLEGSRFTAQSFNIQKSRYIICHEYKSKIEELFNRVWLFRK